MFKKHSVKVLAEFLPHTVYRMVKILSPIQDIHGYERYNYTSYNTGWASKRKENGAIYNKLFLHFFFVEKLKLYRNNENDNQRGYSVLDKTMPRRLCRILDFC